MKTKPLTFLLALTFLFLFSGFVVVDDPPEFHFEEDEQINSKMNVMYSNMKNLYEEIKPPTKQGSLVSAYNSLNVPLTRLDYIAIELDREKSDIKEVGTDYAKEHFEFTSRCDNLFDPYEGWRKVTCLYDEFVNPVSSLDIKIILRYIGELKRVQLAVLVSGLGKPKKSMKSFCLKTLKMAEHKIDSILGDLTSKFPWSSRISNIKNFYVSARSHVPVTQLRTHNFLMECIKSDLSKEIIYNKQSSMNFAD